MKIIDSHQHFWKFDSVRDSWITEEMKVIQRDFLPHHLSPLLAENSVEGCVVVQSDQSEAENILQLQHAMQHHFIKGVVGWVDLRAGDVAERLQYHSQFNKLKGFRHVLQGEAQRDLMLQADFMHGISLLKKYGFTYDLLIYPDQLQYVPTLAATFPDQLFVIDHMAKPNIRYLESNQWKEDISLVAKHRNVYCKLSGMVTEADWKNWQPEDFTPYLDTVTAAFGEDRLMYGSDWPVCLLAASYTQVLSIVQNYFATYSPVYQQKVFADNAVRFYNL